MSPRPDVSEERKNQILEAAVAVFAQQGFQETRMDDIAQRAGLSKGALYLYYKSKDAIIAALLQYFFSLEKQHLQTLLAVPDQRTAREQILVLTQQLTATMKWMVALRPLAFEFYSIAGRQKEVRQFLQDYYQDYRGELAALIQRGIEQGEFREVNPEAVATTLVALYEGLALLFFVDPQAASWTQQIETSVQLLLAGIQAKEGPVRPPALPGDDIRD